MRFPVYGKFGPLVSERSENKRTVGRNGVVRTSKSYHIKSSISELAGYGEKQYIGIGTVQATQAVQTIKEILRTLCLLCEGILKESRISLGMYLLSEKEKGLEPVVVILREPDGDFFFQFRRNGQEIICVHLVSYRLALGIGRYFYGRPRFRIDVEGDSLHGTAISRRCFASGKCCMSGKFFDSILNSFSLVSGEDISIVSVGKDLSLADGYDAVSIRDNERFLIGAIVHVFECHRIVAVSSLRENDWDVMREILILSRVRIESLSPLAEILQMDLWADLKVPVSASFI